MTSETLAQRALSDDPVLRRIAVVLQDAWEQARADDPGAQRLLDAASVLMSSGHRSPNLARIAKQADMPVGGARRIFRDRTALLRAHRYRWMCAYLKIMQDAIIDCADGDRVERVILTFGEIFASPIGVSAARRNFAIWIETCDDPDLRSNFARTEAIWHEVLECLIAAEIGEGAGRFTPRNIALMLSACVDGVVVASGLTPESSEPERVIATSLALWKLVKARCLEGVAP